MSSEPALEVIFPVSLVLLIASQPVHGAVAVPLVIGPHAFVEVATGIGHLAVAPLHAPLPLAFIDRAVLVGERALSMPHAVQPLALVLHALFGIDVLALSMPEPILYLAVVGRLIRPLVTPDPSDLVVFEFAAVDRAVRPVELALAVEEPVLQVALVGVPVAELARSLTVVYFANLEEAMDYGFVRKKHRVIWFDG